MKLSFATRYDSETLAGKHFDVLVIGSGMSGLATAAMLAKEGKSVAVLEKHNKAGGLTHSFRRKNFEWDVGLHYIGDVGSDKSFGKRLFDYVSGGKVHWQKMQDPYDQAIFPDQTYDFVSGHQNFLDQMSEYFPEERKALKEYLDLIKAALKHSEMFFAAKAIPPFLGKPLSFVFDRKFHKYSDKTVMEVLTSLTSNPKLIAVLTTQWGDYGLPPHKASFAIHAMVVNHYLRGGYFPVGGSKVIASAVIDTLREHNSDVYVRAEVSELLVKNGTCFGVKMKNGEEIYAKKVVSSAGVLNTFQRFMPESQKEQFEKPLSHLEPSISHTALYLGLDKTAKDLNLTNGNQWIFPSYDHKKNLDDFISKKTKNFPVVYVSFPSSKDPLWDEEHPGTSTVDVISLMPFSHVQNWNGTGWFKRGDDYLELKEKVIENLLSKTIEYNPQIKNHVVVKELSTPLSTKHFSCYQKGEIYGLAHTPSRFRQKILQPRTPIKNLYLTGQDIVSAGVMGALSSAMLTSIAITNKNLQNKVMSS